MAQINNLTSYPTATPVANSIVIGSIASGDATNNFLMSDIAAFVMGANTLTLQDVCDNGTATTTGITIGGTTTLNGVLDANSTADISGNTTIGGTTTLNGVLDANSTADISGNTTIGGTLGVSQAATFALGVTIDNGGLAINGSGGIIVGSTFGITSFGPISGTALNSTGGLLVSGTSFLGDIDASGVADIADTLTLSKPTGVGLIVNSIIQTSRLSVSSVAAFSYADFSADVDMSPTSRFILRTTPPSSSTDTGASGQIAVDASYIYVCTAANTWGRVAINPTPF